MENTMADAYHMVNALREAGILGHAVHTGGNVYVTSINLPSDHTLVITNESYGDDGWLVCQYDNKIYEDEGVIVGQNLQSTKATIQFISDYLVTYFRDELERRSQA